MRWIHFNFRINKFIELNTLCRLPTQIPEPWADRLGGVADMISALRAKNALLPIKDAARVVELSFRCIGILMEYLAESGITPEFNPAMDRLMPSLEFAEENMDKPMQAKDMARVTNLSLPRFHAEFKQIFRETPMRRLKNLRLVKAGILLRGTSLSIKEISSQTGFCNQFHLSREFARFYGEPPSAYRQSFKTGLALY